MITLDRLVNVLAGSGARLAGGARSREVMLRSLVVHDPTDPRPATGDVYLAVGVDAPAEAVGLAEQARAAVVLVRGPTVLDRATSTAAEQADIAVVLAEPEVSWSHLTGLAYGLVLEGRETESGRGPTDLFALVDTLAAALRGSSVVMEDQLSRVLAYSGSDDPVDAVRSQTILGRRLPDTVRGLFADRGVFRHLATSDEPLFVEPSPAHGFGGRMVIAVRAGRELLGSLWAETATPFETERLRVLEDGARTAALHLLRSRASADLERQVESDLVTRLVEGNGDAEAMRSQLGLPPDALRVVRCRPTSRTSSTPESCSRSSTSPPASGGRGQAAVRCSRTPSTRCSPLAMTRSRQLASGSGRCARAYRDTSLWWPGSAAGPRRRCCRPAAARPTSAWLCTPLTPSSRPSPTTSPGTGSCSAAFGPSPRRVASPSEAPWPSSGATTDGTAPTTSRPCARGWQPTATSVPPRRPSTSIRTPCGTGCGRWTKPPTSSPATPTSGSP